MCSGRRPSPAPTIFLRRRTMRDGYSSSTSTVFCVLSTPAQVRNCGRRSSGGNPRSRRRLLRRTALSMSEGRGRRERSTRLMRRPVLCWPRNSSRTGTTVRRRCRIQAFSWRTRATRLMASPSQAWPFCGNYSTFCEGGGGKTTVYANGRVYTRDYFGNLILDAATGNLLGSFAAQGVNAFAPAVDQTSIFTLAESTLTAKSLADSSVRWTFTGDGQLDMTPIVLSTPGGEFVVVASASGMLYALDATTGTQVWSVNVGTEITQPDEWDAVVLTGLGAGQGLLVVPAGNTVSAYGADTTPPTVTVPPTITVRTQSSNGAAVSYSVTANDPDDTATVSCAPSSSSTFPVGTTTVSCTATDTVGNTASASFLVVVNLD